MKKISAKTYNIPLEQSLVTLHNFEKVSEAIDILKRRPASLTIETIVETVKSSLQLALYGCEVDVGLYTDVNGRVMEYYGDKNFIRKVYKGESSGFRAIDRKESVVETDGKNATVVFIPILGPTVAHGALEIHGLQVEGISMRTQNLRSTEMLKAMLAAKDYSFTDKLRFWKRVLIKSIAGFPQTDSAILISGRITDILYTKNGIPYYGGPRFTLTWEDMVVEREVSGSDLLSKFAESLQSLGAGTYFDHDINTRLLTLAAELGDLLEARKADMFVNELRMKLQNQGQQLNVVGMLEFALQAIAASLSAVKDITLLGYRKDGDGKEDYEMKSLIQHTIDQQAKYARQYSNTAAGIAVEILSLVPSSTNRNQAPPELTKQDAYSTIWLGAEVRVPSGFLWGKSARYDRYTIIVHKGKLYAADLTPYDRQCFFGVLSTIEEAIQQLWQVEQTRRLYRDFAKSIESKLLSWRSMTVPELCFHALAELVELVPCEAYMATLDNGAKNLRFIAASAKSNMEGQVLARNEGVSFEVVESNKSMTFEAGDLDKKKLIVMDAIVDVRYGPKKLYRGKIVKIHGHEKFDVRYDVDNKVETGVDMSRIIPLNKAFKMKIFGKIRLPVVIVPLRNRGKCLGVLAMDTFEFPGTNTSSTAAATAALQASFKISSDLLTCIEQFGRLLGSAIDAKGKKAALEALYVIGKNQYAGMDDLRMALFDAAFLCSCYVIGISFIEFTISDQVSRKRSRIEEGEIPSDIARKIDHFDRAKFGRKTLQKIGGKSAWLICDITSNKAGSGRCFVIVFCFRNTVTDPDYDFLEVLQKTLNSLIQAIVTLKTSGEIRRDALTAIKYLSTSAAETGLGYSEFFRQMCEKVSICFPSANLYAGLLGRYAAEINYILASNKSSMAGKKLRRSEKRRIVSFMAVDNSKTMCVTATSPMAPNLTYFNAKQSFEFPFLVSPISAGVDSVVGVLGVDACGGQNTAETEDQLGDVIAFFQAIANVLGGHLQRYRVDDVRNALRMIAMMKSSLNEGMDDIIQRLFRYLPFCIRISMLTVHPIVANNLISGSTLTESLFVKVCIVSANFYNLTGKERQLLRVLWLGENVCELDSKEAFTMLKPFTIACPSGTLHESLKLAVNLLVGQMKLSAKATLAFPAIEHAECHDHTLALFDSKAADAFVADLTFRLKVLRAVEVVGIRLSVIRAAYVFADGFPINSRRSCNIYATINWSERLIGRTENVAPQATTEWSSLHCFLAAARNPENNILTIEFWIERAKGKVQFIGSASVLIEDLHKVSEHAEDNAVELTISGDASDFVTALTFQFDAMPVYPQQLTREENLSLLHLNDEQMLQSKHCKVTPLKKQRSIRKDEEYLQCEMSVLSAINLSPALGYDRLGCFIYVTLDGVEVGTTAVSLEQPSDGNKQGSLTWRDEFFRLSLPTGDTLDSTLLRVEVYCTDEQGQRQALIGVVELIGDQLAQLFFGLMIKRRWFDIADSNLLTLQDKDAKRISVLHPQLQLSGRPANIKAVDKTLEIATSAELQLSIPRLRINGTKERFQVAMIYFNNQLLHTAALLLPGDGESEEDYKVEEQLLFSFPASRSLFQSELKIEVRVSEANLNKPIFNWKITGSEVIKLIGQPGLVSKEYVVTGEHGNAEIILQAGPKDSLEIFEYEERVLWLDVLGLYNLDPRFPTLDRPSSRPDIYCSVKWNGRNVGKTPIYEQKGMSLLSKQRFVLRIPLISGQALRLSRCSLGIIVHDARSDDVIGRLELDENQLRNQFIEDQAIFSWYKLLQPVKNEEDENHRKKHDHRHVQAWIKLLGQYENTEVSNNNPPKRNSRDYLLQVIEARDLANTDAYGGANVVLEISWEGEILGFTTLIRETTEPKFIDETFIVVDYPDKNLMEKSLAIKAWGLSEPGSGINRKFLGMVSLSGQYLLDLVNVTSAAATSAKWSTTLIAPSTKSKWYTLSTDPELTPDENALVKGRLKISASEINYNDYLHGPVMAIESILWIHSVTNLPSLDALDVYPSSFVVVKRKYEKEGDTLIEIYRSPRMTETSHPRYEREFCSVLIPVDDYWHGFELVIEIYNKREEVLLTKRFIDNEAKELLIREGKSVIMLLDYDIPAPDFNSNDKFSKLRLGGGLKSSFDEFETAIKKPSAVQSTKYSKHLSTKMSAKRVYMKIGRISTTQASLTAIQQSSSSNSMRFECEVKVGTKSCGIKEIKVMDNEILIDGEGVFALESNSLAAAVNEGIDIIFTECLTANKEEEEEQPLKTINGKITINSDHLLNLTTNDWLLTISYQPLRESDYFIIQSALISLKNSPIFTDINSVGGGKNTGRSRKLKALLNKATFSMTLMQLSDLQYFGRITRRAEVYLRFTWGMQANNPKNKATHQTDYYTFESTVDLDGEQFQVQFNENEESFDDAYLGISLHLRKDNKKLAELLLHGDSFADVIQAGIHGQELKLQENETFLAVSPKLRIKIQLVPLSFDRLPLFNTKLPLPDELREVEVTITTAEGLAKLKTIGSTDCYAILRYGQYTIGQTVMVHDSIHPIWRENQTFRIRFPNRPFEQCNQDDMKAGGIFHLTDLAVSIGLYHLGRNGKGVFLGETVIDGEQIQHMLHSNDPPSTASAAAVTNNKRAFYRGSFPLSTSKSLKQSEQRYVKGQVHVVVNEVHRSDVEGKDIEVLILSARGTPVINKDKQPDLFVRVRWNGQIIGSTYTEKASSNPRWDNEKFIAHVHGAVNLEDCVMTIELWQAVKAKHDLLLGASEITAIDLAKIFKKGNPAYNKAFWVSMKPTSHLPIAVQQQNKDLSEVEIRAFFASESHLDPTQSDRYEFELLRCKDLARIDNNVHNTNAYVICKWNNREIGRSKISEHNLNPKWKQQKFTLTIEKGHIFTEDSLVFEVWNSRRMIRKGEYLGSACISGEKLNALFAAGLDEISHCKLTDHLSQEHRVRKFIQGELVFMAKVADDGSGGNIFDKELKLDFLGAYDGNAGQCLFELKVQSVFCQPLLSPLIAQKAIQPSCKVLWRDNLLSVLPAVFVDSEYNASWSSVDVNKTHYLALPTNSKEQSHNDELLLEVWNDLVDVKGNQIGYLRLPITSLLRLYCGTFTFTLTAFDPHQPLFPWRATITFSLKVSFSYWDSISITMPTIFKRRINILQACNLPIVNSNMPNTRCVLLMDGVVLIKSPISANTRDPIYHRISEEIEMDLSKPRIITVEIVFVDPRNRKEIVLGREEIPFENIIRPPAESFEIFLGPSNVTLQDYRFALSGSVKVFIQGSNRFDESYAPYSAQLEEPRTFNLVSELRLNRTRSSAPANNGIAVDNDGGSSIASNQSQVLMEAEKMWIGSLLCYNHPQEVPSRPDWIFLPLTDMGVDIGTKKSNFIGIQPGVLAGFGIQRNGERLAVSDAKLLEDIAFELSECLIRLRWKDINRKLRAIALKLLQSLVEEMIRSEQFDVTQLYSFLETILYHCLPGAVMQLIQPSEDYTTVHYQLPDHFRTAPASKGMLTVSSEYGSDMILLGRNYTRSAYIGSFQELLSTKRAVLLSSSFMSSHQSFPRITTVIHSEDVSIGAVQITNFELYRGGMNNLINDADEIKAWLEAIGHTCGEAIYQGMEANAIGNVTNYLLRYDSTLEGLFLVIVDELSRVLQGYKLMELITFDPSGHKLTSLLERIPPQSNTNIGKKVAFRGIKVSARRDEVRSVKSLSSLGSGAVNEGVGVGGSNWTNLQRLFKNYNTMATDDNNQTLFSFDDSTNDDGSSYIGGDSERGSGRLENSNDLLLEPEFMPNLIFSIQYDGLEHMQALMYDSQSEAFILSNGTSDLTLFLKSSRKVEFSVYQVDEHLNPITQNSGFINLSRGVAGASSMKVMLSAVTPRNVLVYDVFFQAEFDSHSSHALEDTPAMATAATEVAVSYLEEVGVLGFHLTILYAEHIKHIKTNNRSKATMPSPFVEVYSGNRKLVAVTKVIKSNDNPEWNHTVFIPYDPNVFKNNEVICLDVYDMSFLRKGNFLGRVELKLDTLIDDLPKTAFEMQMNADIPAKKQVHVGGLLYVQVTVDKKAETASLNAENGTQNMDKIVEDDEEKVTVEQALTRLLRLRNPYLKLTIHNAQGLAVANRFSGKSDPYALLYMVNNSTSAAQEVQPNMLDNASAQSYKSKKESLGSKKVSHQNLQDSSQLDSSQQQQEECIGKTKVISDDLNPVWEETFTIPIILPANKSIDSVSIHDYPSFRFDIFGHSKLVAPIFLGQCELSPLIYGGYTTKVLPLTTNKNEGRSKNQMFIKGNLTLEWELEDHWDDITSSDNDHAKGTHNKLKYLPSYGKFEIQLIHAENITKQRRLIGTWNPFIKVKFGDLVVGQTRSKSNTINPDFHEKFTVNVNFLDDLPNVTLEIWHRDFFLSDELLAETIISPVDYLHPEKTVQNLTLKNTNKKVTGERIDPTTKHGSGILSVKLAFHIVRHTLPLSLLQRYEFNPFHKALSEHKMESRDMLMIFDPSQEANRQSFEHTNYPNLTQRTSLQQQKYESQSFKRTGLISELHYGQLSAAFRRAERTTLRTERMEEICFPLFTKNPPMTTLTATNASAKFSPAEGKYIGCRYPAGKLPRRDLKFLAHFQSKIIPEILLHGQRLTRIHEQEQLLESITATGTAGLSMDDLICQSLNDIETSLTGLSVPKLFLLEEQGKFFRAVTNDNGTMQVNTPPDPVVQLLARLLRRGLALQLYRGVAYLIKLEWFETDEDVIKQWQLPTWMNHVSSLFEELEGEDFNDSIVEAWQSSSLLADGCIAMPIMGCHELMVGMLLIRGIDRRPHAIYEYTLTDPTTSPSNNRDALLITDTDSDKASAKKGLEVQRLEAPEQMFLPHILRVNAKFAETLINARISNLTRSLKSFPVKPETSARQLLRYAMRLLIVAFPAIKEISIWAVNWSQQASSQQQQGQGGRASNTNNTTNNNRLPSQENSTGANDVSSMSNGDQSNISNDDGSKRSGGLLRRLFTFGFIARPKAISASTSSARDAQVVRASSSAAGIITPAAFNPAENSIARVVCGVFGAEDPRFLLRTPLERKAESRFTVTQSSRSRTSNKGLGFEQMQRDMLDLRAAEWTVTIPTSLRPGNTNNISNEDLTPAFDLEGGMSSMTESGRGAGTNNSASIKANLAAMRSAAATGELVRSEVLRCSNMLHLKSFSVVTGHGLAMVGRDRDANKGAQAAIIQGIFGNGNVKSPVTSSSTIVKSPNSSSINNPALLKAQQSQQSISSAARGISGGGGGGGDDENSVHSRESIVSSRRGTSADPRSSIATTLQLEQPSLIVDDDSGLQSVMSPGGSQIRPQSASLSASANAAAIAAPRRTSLNQKGGLLSPDAAGAGAGAGAPLPTGARPSTRTSFRPSQILAPPKPPKAPNADAIFLLSINGGDWGVVGPEMLGVLDQAAALLDVLLARWMTVQLEQLLLKGTATIAEAEESEDDDSDSEDDDDHDGQHEEDQDGVEVDASPSPGVLSPSATVRASRPPSTGRLNTGRRAVSIASSNSSSNADLIGSGAASGANTARSPPLSPAYGRAQSQSGFQQPYLLQRRQTTADTGGVVNSSSALLGSRQRRSVSGLQTAGSRAGSANRNRTNTRTNNAAAADPFSAPSRTNIIG